MTRAQRVLVTGGSGFIGSHVVRLLLESKRDVALMSRTESVTRARVRAPTEVAVLPYMSGARESVRRSIVEWAPDACIHLAWNVDPDTYLHSLDNLSSLSESLELLTAVIDAGCNRVAMAGTSAEYDSAQRWLKEDSPTRPESLYAATKLSLCLIAERLAAQRDVRLAWGRIFVPYGPGEDPRRAVPSVIRTLLAGQPFPATPGEQIRDYIHVEDVAAAFISLIDVKASGVFNISSGVPVSIRHVLQTIGDILGASDLIALGARPYRDWDPMFLCGVNERLLATGWQPRHSLRAGLEQTVAWWRTHAELTPNHGR